MFDFLEPGHHGRLIHQRGEMSTRDFARLVGWLARRLDECELEPGARVATYLPNSLELLTSYYACLVRGLVVVPINDRLPPHRARALMQHTGARCLLTTGAPHLGSIAVPQLSLRDIELELPRAEPPASPTWPGTHPAILFATSGSTGEPKAALYSHDTLTGNAELFRRGLDIGARDHVVLCHCMSSNFVFAQLTVPFLDVGGTIEIVDFGSVEQTLDAIERGATFLSLIPWFGYRLIEEARERRLTPNRLRRAIVGGDRVPLDYFAHFSAALGIVPAEQLGMTETNTTLINPLVDGDLRLGSVGLPLPGVEVQIRDGCGRAVGPGCEGQIWVRTPGAMAGYWDDPEANEATMRDGWVATGDIGRRDSAGYVWHTGRATQMIIVDGDNIHPGAVERAIVEHPDVRHACVFGLPHPTRGETIAAALVLASGTMTQPELAVFLDGRLAHTMIPGEILVMDRLPETTAGKVDRRLLARSILAGRAETDVRDVAV